MLIHPPMLQCPSLNPEHLLTEGHVCTGAECQCMPALGRIALSPSKNGVDPEYGLRQRATHAQKPRGPDPRCAALRDSLGHTPTTYPSVLLPSITAIIRSPLGSSQERSVLCHQRSDNHFWGFPGGGQHIGESILETVKREVHEETGLDVTIQGLVCVDTDPTRGALCSYPDGNAVQYCNLTFLCGLQAGTLQPSAESLQVAWYPVHQLPEPFLETHRWRLQQAMAWMQGNGVVVR